MNAQSNTTRSIPAMATTSTPIDAPTDPITGREIEDAVKIDYHPHSNRNTKIKSYHDYLRQTQNLSPPTDKQPWAPFCTCTDYEYAEIVLAVSLNAAQNNVLISLIHHIICGEAEFTLRDNTDLKSIWDCAANKLTPVSLNSYHSQTCLKQTKVSLSLRKEQ